MDNRQLHDPQQCSCPPQRQMLHQQIRAAAQQHLMVRQQGEIEIADAMQRLMSARQRSERRNAEAFGEVRRLAALL